MGDQRLRKKEERGKGDYWGKVKEELEVGGGRGEKAVASSIIVIDRRNFSASESKATDAGKERRSLCEERSQEIQPVVGY